MWFIPAQAGIQNIDFEKSNVETAHPKRLPRKKTSYKRGTLMTLITGGGG